MSDIVRTSQPAGSKRTFGNSHGSAARVAADWLCLAATPTFAITALSAALGGQQEFLGAAMDHALPLGGNGPDVSADERLPLSAVAEAGQPTKPRSPALIPALTSSRAASALAFRATLVTPAVCWR